MFSKISRYRKLSDVVITDSKGRALGSKELRLLPEVSGAFFHTIEAVDRLDHVAYKYYKQPRKWWRICDANPEFMSPQALLGKEPIAMTRFPLTFNGEDVPWSNLLKALSEHIGVEDIKVAEEIRLLEEEQTYDGEKVKVYVEHPERAVMVIYNQMNVSAEDLIKIIEGKGFSVGQPESIGRIGKKIVIPPDIVG